MAFTDRIVEFPGRFRAKNVSTQEIITFDMVRDEGTVSEQGTLLSAANLNRETQLDSETTDKYTAVKPSSQAARQNPMSDALEYLALLPSLFTKLTNIGFNNPTNLNYALAYLADKIYNVQKVDRAGIKTASWKNIATPAAQNYTLTTLELDRSNKWLILASGGNGQGGAVNNVIKFEKESGSVRTEIYGQGQNNSGGGNNTCAWAYVDALSTARIKVLGYGYSTSVTNLNGVAVAIPLVFDI